VSPSRRASAALSGAPRRSALTTGNPPPIAHFIATFGTPEPRSADRAAKIDFEGAGPSLVRCDHNAPVCTLAALSIDPQRMEERGNVIEGLGHCHIP
jgi:hypothetical protein